MAPAIHSRMAETRGGGAPDKLFRSLRASLTTRILLVNVIALGLLAGSLFYLDNYRNNLIRERFALAQAETTITANALIGASRTQRRRLISRIGASQMLRMRLYDLKGRLIIDSFAQAGPAFQLVDPANEDWYQRAARTLDRGMDTLLGAPVIEDYRDPEVANDKPWPEIAEARSGKLIVVRQRLAPDRTPVITAAVPVGDDGSVLLSTRNAPDITQSVRDARQTLTIIVGAALSISILFSLFLARTIVRPLRLLVRAAIRVRLGRDREVVVPRLPERRDEIGMLARAISDMSSALRTRIDAVESFAADVAHEIKNPLASLRSALESLDRVDDKSVRRQLSDIAMHDVQRIDRLVTEIADASRIDAELSRTTFEAVDMLRLVKASVTARDERGGNANCPVIVSHTGSGDCLVPGDAPRLERVLENMIDNAVSFSPTGQPIEIEIVSDENRVALSVSDHGPGIPLEAREKVFGRFHSVRPDSEDFGGHSGLGLAIARTIVEAHYGTLTAEDRRDGTRGACLLMTLPAWQGT